MKSFPFLITSQYLNVIRIAVSLMLMAHGGIRLYAGTVGGFGEFLNAKGFFLGTAIAWSITVFELLGGALLALGYFHRVICIGFIAILIAGILLVHINNGWFVVGYSSGGAEYSVLLILCLLLIASTDE
ncbi:DoxX family membrane protein [Reichenbachiella sp.]|uniref:DoxX family membrane protein n=1 Tax=Reichenbachiella sp. TaxID=2184521 RepID=UPI003B5AD3F5